MVGWMRLQQTIFAWNLLQSLLGNQVIYLAASGVVWGLLGLGAALGLWLHRRWAPTFSIAWAVGLAAWSWVERFVLARTPDSRTNLPFTAVITCILLVFCILVSRNQKV